MRELTVNEIDTVSGTGSAENALAINTLGFVGVLNAAVAGAAAGTAFGPGVGTAVGAGVGAVYGGIVVALHYINSASDG